MIWFILIGLIVFHRFLLKLFWRLLVFVIIAVFVLGFYHGVHGS